MPTGLANVLYAEGLENRAYFSDARRVLETVPNLRASAVVLDLIMAGMAGEELLGHLRERIPEASVIVLTGENDVESAVECMRLGAFNYLVKVVDPDRSITTVRRARKGGLSDPKT